MVLLVTKTNNSFEDLNTVNTFNKEFNVSTVLIPGNLNKTSEKNQELSN